VLYEPGCLGGKVAAWHETKTATGYETGSAHLFGALPTSPKSCSQRNSGIEDRLKWQDHAMIFNQKDAPGPYSPASDFPDSAPAPLTVVAVDPGNNDMLTLCRRKSSSALLVPANESRGPGLTSKICVQ